ncbi:MAG: hypothetical protein FJ308_18095 [Planctomycetes bacterium]|nr:hypothetical protein [Planctomycetota bacterium]
MMIMKSPKVKYAPIPVLAAILGYILTREDGDYLEPTSLNANQKINVSTKIAPVEWPVFSLEEIAMLEPFQTLKQLEGLQERGGAVGIDPLAIDARTSDVTREPVEVRAIFQTPNGAAALLGDRIVRVGDVLEDGRRVIAVHPHGVEVSDE